jgi:F-type H+-transporting ATPase subunit delta
MDKLIAKKYAKALIESSDDKKLAGYMEILGAVANSFGDSAVLEAIKSPLIEKDKKSEIVMAALGKKPDAALANLIKLMAQKNRLDLIPDVVSIIAFEQKKASNKFEGTIYSDEKLSDDSVAKLEKSLASYSGADIKLNRSDSDQPGIKVEIEDLGIELGFSREKVKQALIDHIQKAL